MHEPEKTAMIDPSNAPAIFLLVFACFVFDVVLFWAVRILWKALGL